MTKIFAFQCVWFIFHATESRLAFDFFINEFFAEHFFFAEIRLFLIFVDYFYGEYAEQVFQFMNDFIEIH